MTSLLQKHISFSTKLGINFEGSELTTKSTAKELVSFNVRANIVSPRVIQTDLIKEVLQDLLGKKL